MIAPHVQGAAPARNFEDTSEADAALRRAGIDPDAVRMALAGFPLARVDLFGSILGPEFGEGSDVDFLVDIRPEDLPPWGDFSELEAALLAVLRRRPHLTTRRSVEHGRNPVRRQAILGSARPLHVAA